MVPGNILFVRYDAYGLITSQVFVSSSNIATIGVLTAGSNILAENFILALSRQTSLGIIQDNDALIENFSETESNSELAKNLLDDTFESKSDNHDNDAKT